jgi:site-specific DNA recombinase
MTKNGAFAPQNAPLSHIHLRGGIAFTKGPLAYLLSSRVYVGEVRHKTRYYPGEHRPILNADLFRRVQASIAAHRLVCGS